MTNMSTIRDIGVVVVTFNSADVISDCLESLSQSSYPSLRVVVVDNASNDDTIEVVTKWGRNQKGFLDIPSGTSLDDAALDKASAVLVRSGTNLGFAGGVNVGLKLLMPHQGTDLFWVLNPDSQVEVESAARYAARAEEVGEFGLMGGRTIYVHPADTIQSDGGTVNAKTGICSNINHSKPASTTPFPEQMEIHYISGANVVASRKFMETVGLMSEDYFLYYEEVDWALRRNSLKLIYAEEATVKHHGGTSIGSPVIGKIQGTAFSNYFNYRSRMYFIKKFHPGSLVTAYGYSLLKVVRLVLEGNFDEARGAFHGLFDLPPPGNVRARLTEDAARIAFKD